MRDAAVEMAQVGFQDKLTGLLNRAHFVSVIESYLYGERERPAAVANYDVVNFKSVDDNISYVVGDEFLKAVAVGIEDSSRHSEDRLDAIGRLRSTRHSEAYFAGTLAEEHRPARIGGDEFAVMLNDINIDKLDEYNLARQKAVKVLSCPSLRELVEKYEPNEFGIRLGISLIKPEHKKFADVIHASDPKQKKYAEIVYKTDENGWYLFDTINNSRVDFWAPDKEPV
jgi:GGDEF domain-containing protein